MLEELMEDLMALLASLSGQFHPLRSEKNQRLLVMVAPRLVDQ